MKKKTGIEKLKKEFQVCNDALRHPSCPSRWLQGYVDGLAFALRMIQEDEEE